MNDVGENGNEWSERRRNERNEPRRSREKGASLFLMIPLERWNVEREGHFRGGVKEGKLGQP